MSGKIKDMKYLTAPLCIGSLLEQKHYGQTLDIHELSVHVLLATLKINGHKLLVDPDPLTQFMRDSSYFLPGILMHYNNKGKHSLSKKLYPELKSEEIRSLTLKNKFEGGNLLTSKNHTFFNNSATGRLTPAETQAAFNEISTAYMTKNTFKKRGLQFHSLTLNPTLTKARALYFSSPLYLGSRAIPKDHPEYTFAKALTQYYYHLDCFMSVLPDQRVLVLNMKLFSDESQALLRETIGDKLIDLEYEPIYERPVMMNILPIQTHDAETVLLVNNIPGELSTTIHDKTGLLVKTAQLCFDDLPDAIEIDLPIQDPCKLSVEKKGTKGIIHLNSRTEKTDFVFDTTAAELDFMIQKGGPHCLVTEILSPSSATASTTPMKEHTTAGCGAGSAASGPATGK